LAQKIDIPLFPFVAREYSYHGSFWGNFRDLSEVVALAQSGKIKHSIQRVKFDDINDSLNRVDNGDVIGRAVIVYD
jgi:alcohol dehydrogenase, propanol-preferring